MLYHCLRPVNTEIYKTHSPAQINRIFHSPAGQTYPWDQQPLETQAPPPPIRCKNTLNNIRNNVAPPEPSHSITVRPEQPTTNETEENYLKNDYEDNRGH